MKWDNIRLKIAKGMKQEILTSPMRWCELLADSLFTGTMMDFLQCRDGRGIARTSIKEVTNQTHKMILKWDVRQVGRLRELFPHLFPHSLAHGELIAGMDGKGDWCVDKQ